MFFLKEYGGMNTTHNIEMAAITIPVLFNKWIVAKSANTETRTKSFGVICWSIGFCINDADLIFDVFIILYITTDFSAYIGYNSSNTFFPFCDTQTIASERL